MCRGREKRAKKMFSRLKWREARKQSSLVVDTLSRLQNHLDVFQCTSCRGRGGLVIMLSWGCFSAGLPCCFSTWYVVHTYLNS